MQLLGHLTGEQLSIPVEELVHDGSFVSRALRHHHLPGNLPALASTSLSVTVPYRAAIADINQASMQGGRHTLRVCVETGGFTLDEITLEPKASGTCNDDGT